ncbi:MAG TPA: PHB depolymerase family esterase [Ideonella sp.]|uniref:extracellular catalytic domain type 1 short-chain-length polyhydroxyalkanoate depolymerase n=1 Tax=Ideonella sp. TaxID=1929293 RepID=UPI002BAED990|nr:PHB depolymerase family esterase [Ideonella sp.]HSI46964.1 PHB depolymerase family esterase [Ideonella sp.]
MPLPFQDTLAEATRLTRSGQLQAATELLRKSLGRPWGPAAPAHSAAPQDVIDVEATELPREPTGATPSPGGTARFLAGQHECAAGQRSYKLFVPPGAGERAMPLVVMLHGCTQHPDDFAAGTAMNAAAVEQGFVVLYPAQSQQANPQRCWSWFKHNHQQRGRGEPAVLASMTQQVIAEHGIDASRVYVAGLSAGGAMAAILGALYPELFAAVGVHSGLAAGAAADLPSALAAMKGQGGAGRTRSVAAPIAVPTIVFHGDADTTVHPSNGAAVIAACVGAGAVAEQQSLSGASGRDCTRSVYRQPDGRTRAEHWLVHGAGHAWSGGQPAGSYTDPRGPDATEAMLRFFMQHRHTP